MGEFNVDLSGSRGEQAAARRELCAARVITIVLEEQLGSRRYACGYALIMQ